MDLHINKFLVTVCMKVMKKLAIFEKTLLKNKSVNSNFLKNICWRIASLRFAPTKRQKY